jgi:hypothetical protein
MGNPKKISKNDRGFNKYRAKKEQAHRPNK